MEAFLALIEQPESERGGSHRVSVCVEKSGRAVEITVSDDGDGFDWRAPPVDGHGLSILHRVFDDVRWNPRGDTVHLTLHGDDA